jgi:hypothetical protein
VTFEAAGDDLVRLGVSPREALTGLPLPEARATSRLSLRGNAIGSTVVDVHFLPPGINRRASGLLDFTTPLPDLPAGINLLRLRVASDGVECDFEGRDVLLTPLTRDH